MSGVRTLVAAAVTNIKSQFFFVMDVLCYARV
jgi:hypothetical protein